jgi:hypothetical protein
MSTPENEPISWRDVEDQLTPEQVQKLRELERQVVSTLEGGSRSARHYDESDLITRARSFALENLTAAYVGPVPIPAGVDHASTWEDADPQPYRVIWGAERSITDEIDVSSCACQFADGSIDDGRSEAPSVYVGGYRVPVDRARAMISALQECLDEIDGWTRA